ncbi:MAG: PKD domain-containing protein, partial [bacterium]
MNVNYWSIMKSDKRGSLNLLFCALGIIFLCGCGGGGGGGDRGGAIPGAFQAPAAAPGRITGKILIATANAGRIAPREADAFLSKIPANTPQSLEIPETGYEPLANAQVTMNVNGTVKSAVTDAQGNWLMTEAPAGTQNLVLAKNGKNVTVPITVASNKENAQLTLITEDNTGNWQVEGQLIHGDGTDGYKKETHADSTSDTVFEDGTRDHHSSNGNTDRDVTDDGIVDQRFPDPNDDGVPDGPVIQQGGEAPTNGTPSTLVDNSPPEIQSITSKDNKGKKSDIVETGGQLDLELNVHDPDGGALNVHWKVEDAEGNDVTSLFLNSSDIIAPTFSPPQGEYNKPGAYIVIATTTDASGASTEKDIIITVDSPDNKAPHASIKANHTAGDAPLTVDFTCDAFDTDGSIVSYCWDFDKSNGISQNNCDDTQISVTKTFISEGKYRVTCIVTDNKGATAFAKRVVVVHKKNSPPVITKFTPDKTTASSGEKVRISVTVTDSDGDKIDTAFTTTGGVMSDTVISDGFVEWTAPTVPGEYIIQITATDANGDEDTEFTKIKVETPANKPPTVKATATPSNGNSPLTVALSAVATDPDGSIASLTWDYDDSDGIRIDASGAAATVKYGGPGEYIATVIACDNAGACASDKIKIVVTQSNRQPFISNCSAAASSAVVGDTIALSAQATDEDNNDLTYNWSVNGGTLSAANDLMPRWTVPTVPGDYTATVSVSDGKSAPVACETILTVNQEKLEKQPDPPASCNATGGNAIAVIQWEPSSSSDIDHYKLLRSLNGGAFSVINSNISKTAQSIEDSGLANGSAYSYQLMAVNTMGFVSAACEEGMQVVPRNEVDEVIPVGKTPSDVEYDPFTNKIFVPNTDSDTVSVIDGGTNEVIITIPVGDQPIDICGDTVQRLMYVTNRGSDNVSVINEDSGAVVRTIAVGHSPDSCVVNELTKDVFVGNKGDNTVSVVDGNTGAVKDTISIGSEPRVCDANENLNVLYVTDRVNDKLDLIDMTSHQLLYSVATGNGPEGCVSNDTTGEVYVPNKDDGTVTVHKGDTGEVKDTISVGGNPTCTCSVNTISNQIYITNKTLNQVHLINGATKEPQMVLHSGNQPAGSCAMAAANKICVANGGGDTVTVINNPLPPFVVDPYPPSNPTHCFATAKDGQVAIEWNACTDDDLEGYKILRGVSSSGPFAIIAALITDTQYIDTTVMNGTQYYYQVKARDRNGNDSDACFDNAAPEKEVVNVVKTGGKGPCCMDTVDNQIFIANEETNTVDVINRDTFEHITTINVPDCCGDMVADHVHNKIYISNKTTNKITVIDGTNYIIEKVIDVGGRGSCSYNDITNNIYITNEETNELIIHNPDTEETHTVYVGGCPCDTKVDHVTNKIYVT